MPIINKPDNARQGVPLMPYTPERTAISTEVVTLRNKRITEIFCKALSDLGTRLSLPIQLV